MNRQAQRDRAWQAHTTAAWSRARKMPRWETVSARFDRYGPPKDPQQLLAQAERITALMKARKRGG